MGFLAQILDDKRVEVEQLVRRQPFAELRQAAQIRCSRPSLLPALLSARSSRRLAVIAEVKTKSPSRGRLAVPGLDPAALARRYQLAGADALSVLTDRQHFGGSIDDLRRSCSATAVPVLRKDFIVHPAQIYEAAVAGAAGVLLIAAAFTGEDSALLSELLACCQEVELDALVEVHREEELERVLALTPAAAIIGVNARDLHSFEVDLTVVERLVPGIPGDRLVVAESGIHTRADALRVAGAGADAVLVGESLVRAAATPTGVEALIAELQVERTPQAAPEDAR